MMKIYKAGAALTMLFLFIFYPPLIAEGSELSEQIFLNTEVLTEEQMEEAEEAVGKIPDGIIDRFREEGGNAIFRTEPIKLLGSEDEIVLGLYWLDDHTIEIWSDQNFYKESGCMLTTTILHEFGHFVYDMSHAEFSEKSKETLHQAYQYYSQYTPQCSNENETFACMYAWYHGNMSKISEEICSVILEAETLCIERNRNNFKEESSMSVKNKSVTPNNPYGPATGTIKYPGHQPGVPGHADCDHD